MTAWTLVLIVIVLGGKPHTLTIDGFGSERQCNAAAIAHGIEALGLRMTIAGFDCVPGNA